MASTIPAWMEGFEEEEEWVSDGPSLSSPLPAIATGIMIPNQAGSGSINFATPIKQTISSSHSMLLNDEGNGNEGPQESPTAGGTFLIREDQPLPDTPLGLGPGQLQLKRGGSKTIFSPLPLERLFDPPSPPTAPTMATSPRSTTPPLPPPKPVFAVLTATTPKPEPRRSKLSQSYLPPPSSPETVKDHGKSGATDEIEATDLPGLVRFDGRKPSSTFQFTFSVPRTPMPRINSDPSRQRISPANPSPNPRANSTPHTPWRYHNSQDSIFSDEEEEQQEEEPSIEEADKDGAQEDNSTADPRLKLFRLQYDTYTRDHLGALADSIAVKDTSLRPESHSGDEEPVWRSTKRIKLSPKEDFSQSEQSFRTSSSRDFHQSPWGKVQTRSFFKGTINLTVPPAILKGDGRLVSQRLDSQETSMTFEEVSHADPSPPKSIAVPDNAGLQRHSSGSSTTTVTEPAVNSLPQTFAKRVAVNYRLQGVNILAQIKKDVFLAKSDAQHSIVVEEDSLSASLFGADIQGHLEDAEQEGKEDDTKMSKSTLSRPKSTTPRKLLRRISAADEVDKEVLSSRDISVVDSPARPTSAKRPADTQLSPVKAVREASIKVTPTIIFASQVSTVTFAQPVAQPTLPTRQPSTAPTSLHPNHHIPASHDDMNRFVSSSTLASGISGTTAGSFVKHAGPPNLRTIRPEELQGVLGAKVGKMTYSKERQMWVKVKEVEDGVDGDGDGDGDGGTTSDDPFGDIESLEVTPRSDRIVRSVNRGGGEEGVVERSFVINPVPQRRLRDEEIAQNEEEIAIEDEDAPVPPPPQINPNLQFDSDFTATTNADDNNEVIQADAPVGGDSNQGPVEEVAAPATEPLPIARSLEELNEGIANISLQMDLSPPRPARPTKIRTSTIISTTTPVVSRTISTPAPSSSSRPQIFPRSALKQPTPQKPTTPRPLTNPDVSHRRSVSFSDGRNAGKIRGLASPTGETEDTVTEPSHHADEEEDTQESAETFVPSARTRRISNLLEGLEGADDTSGGVNTFITRSREGGSGQVSPPEKSPTSADPAQLSSVSSADERQDYHDLPEQDNPTPDRAPKRTLSGRAVPDGTFLTEASFRVTHDQLVRVLTSVQPYEPYWEELKSIDLSRKGLDSLTRLKEFLPSLEKLTVEGNRLTWLSGVPSNLRGLFAANNMFTSITSYTHLPNLEGLDISHSKVESLQQLECLRHLRELKLDGNCVTRLDGIAQLDGLVKASIRGNAFDGVLDLARVHWPRMEVLDLSENRLTDVRGIGRLKALISLNLDNNELEAFNTPTITKAPSSAPSVIVNLKLRVLRLSGNRLARLELGSEPSSPVASSWCAFPGLRTLYADDNCLGELVSLESLTRLENLSLREQRRSDGIVLSARSVRDIKRLYLSGNALPAHLFVSSSPLYNLVYLELASCRLTSLPNNLAACVPNLRVLNLNYNFLTGEDIVRSLTTSGGGGIKRLRKLTAVGGRVKSWKGVVGKLLRGLGELEVLDFRMNPFTLGWYFPLLVNASDLLSAVQPTCASSAPLPQQYHTETSPSSPSREAAAAPQKPWRKSPYAPTWMELDERFRRDLPDAVYVERLAYRGLVMRACDSGSGGTGGKLKMLDGVDVTDGEREKAGKLLSGLEKAAAAKAQVAASASGEVSSHPLKEKRSKAKVRSAPSES
ncbi:hypothetical protein FRB93_008526 [Tulasnella sp. JGI-2019a]|nr:hypothetical protein FRB93_008526 [Tulasnella sp. JGI-2019a]